MDRKVARRKPAGGYVTQYSDAERAAYWKEKAMKGSKSGKSPAYYRYKSKAQDEEIRRARIAARKEPGYISTAGGAVGGAIGSALGGPAGVGIGALLGGKLGHLVEQVTGFGEYKVASNSILRGGMSPPQIVNSVNTGSTIIRHREYVADIVASTGFSVQSFLINPGLKETFPWLSQIAGSYEQYRLRGVLFEFKSTSSDALLSSATSTALGTVMMSTDYDVADDPPEDKRVMLNAEFSNSSKPSCTFIHPIECKRSQSSQNILYTRSAKAVPSGFDQRLYDFARFNIATEGMQAAGGVLGELWITYEIELFKQQYHFAGLTDHFRLGAVTNTAPLGTAVQSNIAAGGTMGGLINGPGTAYSFPPNIQSGKYLVTYFVLGGSTSVVLNQPTLTNCVGLPYNCSDTNWWLATSVSTTMVGMMQMTIQVTAPGAVITFPSQTLPTSVSCGDFYVTRIADSIIQQP